eukprot:GEMP01033192.1.p1 GENE.GEMP01033192.1~~GEMP01033192.1.p1  ORF type:complete len:436 (+),score=55.09 GEMP01033192.1:23-1309(+)
MIADIKVATIGNVDSGKSTLVGVLSKNLLDDGRGLARSMVFNFIHEQQNGRTSSIAHEIMGFREGGQVLPASSHMSGTNCRNNQWCTIVKRSDKLITFIDLCGHERYLKTTIFGLVGLCPDYAMVSINANSGLQRMTREHLGIALALKIPVFVVITKIDICPDKVFQDNMANLTKLLRSAAVRRLPIIIKNEHDALEATSSIASDRVCPIFFVSSVTGDGLALLRSFLRQIPSRMEICGLFSPSDAQSEFHIDAVYSVSGVGVIVAGLVRSGTFRTNQQVLIGPDKNGQFRSCLVRSIHHKRTPCECAYSGQQASFSVRSLVKKEPLKRPWFRKGMVVVDSNSQPLPAWCFEAEVVILHHATTIREQYQAVIHCGVIRQSAQVLKMSEELLRAGDKSNIRFASSTTQSLLSVAKRCCFAKGRQKASAK